MLKNINFFKNYHAFRIVNKNYGITTKRRTWKKFTKILFLPVIDRRTIDRARQSSPRLSSADGRRWSHAARIDPRKSRNQGKGGGEGSKRRKKKEKKRTPEGEGEDFALRALSFPISGWTFSAVTVHGYWLLLATSSLLLSWEPRRRV